MQILIAASLFTPCYCEGHPHFLSLRGPARGRGNLSFCIPLFPSVLPLGTRDCHVGTKTVPPRNDVGGRPPAGCCHCEPPSFFVIARPRKGPWQSLFLHSPIHLGHQRLHHSGQKAPFLAITQGNKYVILPLLYKKQQTTLKNN